MATMTREELEIEQEIDLKQIVQLGGNNHLV